LDIFIPTRRGVVTKEYLGHLAYDKPANLMYHSLVDTKAERELIKIRKKELIGMEVAASGESALIDSGASVVSDGLWMGLTGLLGVAGIMIPTPGTRARVEAAGRMSPEDFDKIKI
jgi:hypothetical protein